MSKNISYYHRNPLKDNLDINQDSYEFIEDTMNETHIPIEERELFWKEFAIPYMSDVIFRYKTHGKYVLFHRNKYIGVVNSVEEARVLYPEKGREISYIGDDKIDGYCRPRQK